LHWAIVLLLGAATLGIFLDIWLIVQAVWVRRLEGSGRALWLCVAGIVLSILGEIVNALQAPSTVTAVVLVASLATGLFAAFAVRDSLAFYIARVTGRPVSLSGTMTIFFGSIYLQYHMNRVRALQEEPLTAGAR
jgi:hypothetical protein